MQEDIAIAFAFAAASVLIVNQIGRVLRTRMLHGTLRKAIEHNASVTPELFDKLEGQKASGGFGDDRIGLVLIAIGLATFCFGLIQGDPDDIRNVSSIGVFPLFVGAVLFGRWFLTRGRTGAEG
jgi:hypothetical protein